MGPDANRMTVDPRCPRCGYDQRGIVATWSESCPVEGTCAECGLVFRWVEVLQPGRFEPQWCVEYAPRRRALPRAVLSTYIRSFWPWRFFSRLQMSHRIRWRRLTAYVILLHVLLLFGYVSEQTTVAVRVRWAVEQEIVQERQATAAQIQRLVQIQQSPEWGRMDPMQRLQYQRYLQNMRAYMNAPYAVNHSYVAAIFEAVVFPFSGTSRGTVSDGGGVWPYVSPDSLHGWLNARSGGFSSGTTEERLYTMCGYTFWMAIAFPLLPLGFICLPISRRRAKVRWGHIARVTAYGFIVPCTIVFALATCIGLAFAFPTTGSNPFTGLGLLVICGVAPAAVILWWAVAIKRYLRLPHGWAVAFLLAVIAALLPLALAALPAYFIGRVW